MLDVWLMVYSRPYVFYQILQATVGIPRFLKNLIYLKLKVVKCQNVVSFSKKIQKTTIHQHFSSVLKVEGQQGTSASLVIPAVGQTECLAGTFKTYIGTRFVIIKMRNLILCTVKSGRPL